MSNKTVYLTFAKAAAIRAIRTFLQAFLAAGAVTGIAAGVFDWETIGQAALTGLGGAILSVLLSALSGLPEADTTVRGSTIVSLGKHAAPDTV
jgi:membrane associated rhomboid family serine protease